MEHVLNQAEKWRIAYAAWRRRWINRQRKLTVIRYNVLYRFPFFTWPTRLLALLGGVSFFSALALLTAIEMGTFGKLPGRSDLVGITSCMASEVLAADGTVLGRYYYENRSHVRFDQISSHFIDALVATEDARYFHHTGVDLRSWMRVLVKTVLLKDRSSGGGSTLSQQLAKNLYPREDYPFGSLLINKLREVLIARRLELLYSKEEILELYLNTVSFSENTYGIKVAAQRFFNTSPRFLTPDQSAVLVAMLKAPTTYNPVSHPEFSLGRRNLVLQQMARYGYLSAAVADSLQREPLCLEYFPLAHDYGPATYFREHLRLELKDLLEGLRKDNGMAYNLYTDGLKIYTTLDPTMQEYAEAAVAAYLRELQEVFDEHLLGANPWEVDTVPALARINSERYRNLSERGFSPSYIDSIFNTPVDMTIFNWKDGERHVRMTPMDSIRYYLGLLNAGLLAMEPNTGRIKAWVGGIDYKFFKYDHVKSRRQVGSTFKPIVYATAIQQGIPPCSYTLNALRTYGQYENWTPRNATNNYGGYYSMEGGLINSINTVTVSLAMRARPKNVAQLARNLGISGDIPNSPAIALGAIDASLLDMVTVYGTFANRGRRPAPYYIRRIEAPGGKVLFNFEQERDTCAMEQPLFAGEADMVNQMLRSAVNNGTGRRLRWRYAFTNDMAGKTGTSQNHSDGWFMGYNPALVTGVWVGAESPAVRFRNITLGQGANTALPVFAEFFKRLNADKRFKKYTDATFVQPAAKVETALRCPNISWPGQVVDSTQQATPVVAQTVRMEKTVAAAASAGTVGAQNEAPNN